MQGQIITKAIELEQLVVRKPRAWAIIGLIKSSRKAFWRVRTNGFIVEYIHKARTYMYVLLYEVINICIFKFKVEALYKPYVKVKKKKELWKNELLFFIDCDTGMYR